MQSLSVDEKWFGAPCAAMLRRHQSEKSDGNEYVLHVAVVLLPTSSSVKHVKYLSIVLQVTYKRMKGPLVLYIFNVEFAGILVVVNDIFYQIVLFFS